MAFSIISFLKQVVSSLFVALIVSIPIVWIMWKIKQKKIKRLIPGDMDKKIKEHKIIEKEVQDAREKREKEREKARQLPAINKIGRGEQESIKRAINSKPREKPRGKRVLPKAAVDVDDRKKSNSKQDWPSFD